MRIPPVVWVIVAFVVLYMVFSPSCERRRYDTVGVGMPQVTTKIDLTDKLNPAILPDLLKEVLREAAPTKEPNSQEFQQLVVRKLSEKIMADPEVNYRVDLNDDKQLDPVLVFPESVKSEAAVYSIRVPDPQRHPKDPSANSNWSDIAKRGIELCALSVTFDEQSRKMVVDAEPNEYLYENSGRRHYRSEYHGSQHSWMNSYLRYMIFRDMLFGPYRWRGGGWYGGWYGGYYGGWRGGVHSRAARTVTRTTRYRPATSTTKPMSTRSGAAVRSSKASSRTAAPKSITAMKSKRAMAARQSTASSRSGGFGRSRSSGRGGYSRSSGGSFRGGGSGWGK